MALPVPNCFLHMHGPSIAFSRVAQLHHLRILQDLKRYFNFWHDSPRSFWNKFSIRIIGSSNCLIIADPAISHFVIMKLLSQIASVTGNALYGRIYLHMQKHPRSLKMVSRFYSFKTNADILILRCPWSLKEDPRC